MLWLILFSLLFCFVINPDAITWWVLWIVMTSRWTFSSVSVTSDYHLSISFCINSLLLSAEASSAKTRGPAVLYDQLKICDPQEQDVYTCIAITLFYICRSYRKCSCLIKERERAWRCWSNWGHIFKDTLQKEARCLSFWLTPPNFLSSCHDNARPHTETSLALFLSESISLPVSISDSQLQRASESTS